MLRMRKIVHYQLARFILLTLVLAFMSCTKSDQNGQQEIGKSYVQTVQGMNALQNILDASGDRLLMFDLYADWCRPCRILSPIVEEIAKEHSERVAVYKIDIDQNRDIAREFGVTGIPYVVFVKNKTSVYALTGVQPKETYVRAIYRFSQGDRMEPVVTPDGEIINGVRLIEESKPLILDVRTPNEYHSGHIEGAKLIPLQQLEDRLSEIEKHSNEPILVYCRSGNRSTVASEILIRNGFKKLYNLRRGIIGWQRDGNPVSK